MALTFPAERRLIDVTGGHDSRLVVATAFASGVSKDYEYHTQGPDALADVIVASSLADTLGLPLLRDISGGDYVGTYEERALDYLRFGGGLYNLFSLKSPLLGTPDWVRLSGFFGEHIRSKVPRAFGTVEEATAFRLKRSGTSDLLLPPTRRWWRRHLRRVMDSCGDVDSTPNDYHDTFQWKERSRSIFGIRESYGGIARLYPMYSRSLIRLAFAEGFRARQEGKHHCDLLARGGPAFTRHPFVNGPLRACQQSDPIELPDLRATGIVGNLGEVLRSSEFDAQRRLLAEAFSDRTNPIWSHLDRARCLERLTHFERLSIPERRELLGAGTGALWLGALGA